MVFERAGEACSCLQPRAQPLERKTPKHARACGGATQAMTFTPFNGNMLNSNMTVDGRGVQLNATRWCANVAGTATRHCMRERMAWEAGQRLTHCDTRTQLVAHTLHTWQFVMQFPARSPVSSTVQIAHA